MSQNDHDDFGIVLAMTYIAWSDRELKKSELDLIRQEASDQGLDQDEIDRLITVMLSGEDSLHEIKQSLTTAEARMAAAFSAYVAAIADHELQMSELDAFERMCAALGLSQEAVGEVRRVAEQQVRLAQSGDWRDSLLLERLITLDASDGSAT